MRPPTFSCITRTSVACAVFAACFSAWRWARRCFAWSFCALRASCSCLRSSAWLRGLPPPGRRPGLQRASRRRGHCCARRPVRACHRPRQPARTRPSPTRSSVRSWELSRAAIHKHPVPHAGHDQRQLDLGDDLAGGLDGIAGLVDLFALGGNLEVIHDTRSLSRVSICCSGRKEFRVFDHRKTWKTRSRDARAHV